MAGREKVEKNSDEQGTNPAVIPAVSRRESRKNKNMDARQMISGMTLKALHNVQIVISTEGRNLIKQ